MKILLICPMIPGWEQSVELLLEAATGLRFAVELWLVGPQKQLENPFQLPPQAENFPELTIEKLPCESTDANRYLELLLPMIAQTKPQVVLMDGGVLGRELATRLGMRMNTRSLTGITALEDGEEGFCVTRNLYGGNLSAQFAVPEVPAFLALQAHPQLEEEEKDSLKSARIILAMGRGAGNQENRQKLTTLAHRLGAALGATRPAALDGYLPMERMLGISGVIAKPELCISFGSSGATPFLMGVNDSKTLVAINRDPQSLVFRYCDIGICETSEEITEELLKLIPEPQEQ